MSEPDNIAPAASPGTTREKHGKRVSIGAMLIFWLLALLALVVLGMQFGLWRKEVRIAGPFAAETLPSTHALMLTIPEDHRAPWWAQPLIGDSAEKPLESRLILKINGISAGPAHAQHASIRAGTGSGFSHWGRSVIFSLPPGIENAAATTVALQYSIQPRPWISAVVLVASGLFGWLLYHAELQRLWRSHFIRGRAATGLTWAIRTIYVVSLSLCALSLVGAVIFLASSAYALASGWALPTTAPIRWWPIAQWASTNEIYFPYVLLALAALGVVASHLAGFSQNCQPELELNEARLQRVIKWAGFPIAICAFVFSVSAMWSGQLRPGDLQYSAWGGLVPFSDAFGYHAAAHDQVRDGTLSDFAMRRPYAAAFRSVLLFVSEYSLPVMLLLQACLLGAAAWWASRAVMAWRGLWAGLAFFSLTYIYARIFAPTTLTESLGLFWALLSIPFFIASFRTASARPALIGFGLTVFALMTRMGNMFAIPALLLWLVWQFGHGMAAKVRIGVLSVAFLLAAFGLNSQLQKAYGSGSDSTGSNFSYTLCGLTIGTTWDGCPKKLQETRDPNAPALSEQAMVAQMYAMAGDNFRAHPQVFFQRIADSIREFYAAFPRTIWGGYGQRVEEPAWFPHRVLVLLILFGLGLVAIRRANAIELSFWALFCASITASAALVFYDDGNRVLAASHPIVALLLATGLTTRPLKQPSAQYEARLTRCGVLGLLLAAALMATIPWISHRVSPAPAVAGSALPLQPNDVLVYGGKRMAGFLIVADGEPLRADIPSIHLSDFSAIVAMTGVEEVSQGLLHPVMPALPFGFVFAPRTEPGAPTHRLFIVPAEVMERRDVPAWRFTTAPWNHKKDVKGNYWVNVTAATPLMLKGQ